jgi:BirA family biotin operon repressor/biotin-[acetyl-CoA-carboxylase] ligase
LRYHLVAVTTNILAVSQLVCNLKARLIGKNISYYPRLASTMDMAREKARQKAAEGTVILAGEQTGGRGRIKRLWISPPGSVSLSVILYPDMARLNFLVMMAALAVARSIEQVIGLKTSLKWPNDVLIRGKKVCGILIESDLSGSTVSYAIIGIGVNVNFSIARFPEIAGFATTLSDELGSDVPLNDLVGHLLADLDHLYRCPETEVIYREWRDQLETLGKRVTVTSGKAILQGTAESVTRDGSLIIRREDGTLAQVIAGDVNLRDSP